MALRKARKEPAGPVVSPAVVLPTVGRIVHVTGEFGELVAAVVTHVHDGLVVDVTAFPRGQKAAPMSVLKHGHGVGQWRWPERV